MFAVLLSSAFCAVFTAREEARFVSWMRATNQIYTGSEYQFRLGVFMTHARFVEEHNRRGGFRVALNKFAAMTKAEYEAMLGFRMRATEKVAKEVPKRNDLPESVDWREQGVVNPIRDQGQCGSCWSFGAICTCESMYAIKRGELLQYSESNLVDCVMLCFGCNGGRPDEAIAYVTSYQGGKFMSQADYPYTPAVGTCAFDESKAIGHVNSYKSVSWFSESDLQDKIANVGVCAVCIDASADAFQLYESGIYEESSCSWLFLDHAVACVGYGTEEDGDYWIVRNSWGTDWGMEGYFKLARNKSNMCGIATEALYANID